MEQVPARGGRGATPPAAQRRGGDGDGEQRSAESSGPNGEGRDAVDGSREHSDGERTDAVKTTRREAEVDI